MSEFLNSAGTKYLLEKIKNNYLSTADTSTITSLIGVDTTPTANSDNLITSGGVKGALDDIAASAHTHTNKSVLDAITTGKTQNWDNAYASAHTHSNQAVLDNLTQGVIDSAHTHSNKSVLDGISSNDVSNWNNKANSAHTHGYITSAGTMSQTGVWIGNNDRLVIVDASNNSAITPTYITFDGSTTTKVLSKSGTWEDIPEDMTNAEIDAIWDGIMAGVITFTIDGDTYQADAGMTWQQWVNSNYNVVTNPYTGSGSVNNGNFYIEGNAVGIMWGLMNGGTVRTTSSVDDEVAPSDTIIPGYSYVVSASGGEPG